MRAMLLMRVTLLLLLLLREATLSARPIPLTIHPLRTFHPV
jgi:hypothetical protein